MPASVLFFFFSPAVIVKVHWWFWCWLEQRSQGEHVWYDCWRFSAIKQMDYACLGTMCLEVFSSLQGCFPIILWLWKGNECSNPLVFLISKSSSYCCPFSVLFFLLFLLVQIIAVYHWLWCLWMSNLCFIWYWYRHYAAANIAIIFYKYEIMNYLCKRAILRYNLYFQCCWYHL